jgi:hypothetical protein
MAVDMTYSFLSEAEPTDEQLKQLMREVGAEARERFAEANQKYWEQIYQNVKDSPAMAR